MRIQIDFHVRCPSRKFASPLRMLVNDGAERREESFFYSAILEVKDWKKQCLSAEHRASSPYGETGRRPRGAEFSP
jgi:hypothetical protein